MEEKNKTFSGIITEAFPNALFKVAMEDNREVLAYLSGKMRMHRIKVLIGDKVDVFLDDFGGRGRITRRN